MSRVADNPVNIPDGVTVVLDHPEVLVKPVLYASKPIS